MESSVEAVEQPTSRRHVAKLGMVCVLLLVVASAGLFVRVTSQANETTIFCAGVGIVASGSSPSPEIAFSEWLTTRPDQPPMERWKRTEDKSIAVTHDPDSVVFKNTKHNGGYVGGLAVVTLRKGGTNFNTGGLFPPDEWSVDGACVGPPPIPHG